MESTTSLCPVPRAEIWRYIFLGLLIIEIAFLVLLGLSFTILFAMDPGLTLSALITRPSISLVGVLLLCTLATLASYAEMTEIAWREYVLSPMNEEGEEQDKESELREASGSQLSREIEGLLPTPPVS